MEGSKSIADHLGSVFDSCDDLKTGMVVTSKLMSFISNNFLSRCDEIRTSPDSVYSKIYQTLDPQNEDCKVDRVKWLAAWEPHIDVCVDNNNWNTVCNETKDLSPSLDSIGASNESPQSFTYSPGSYVSPPGNGEMLNDRKAQLYQLLEREKYLKSQLEISEDSFCQEQTLNEKLRKENARNILTIERLKQDIVHLEEAICELKASLLKSEEEKLELCTEIQKQEDLRKLTTIKAEALQLECTSLSDELGKAAMKINCFDKEREKLNQELKECINIVFNKNEELHTLVEENKTLVEENNNLKDVIDQSIIYSKPKMEQRLLDVSFEELDEEPLSLLAEGAPSLTASQTLESPKHRCSLQINQCLSNFKESASSLSISTLQNSLFEEFAAMGSSHIINSDGEGNLSLEEAVEESSSADMEPRTPTTLFAERDERHGSHQEEFVEKDKDDNQRLVIATQESLRLETCHVSTQTVSFHSSSNNGLIEPGSDLAYALVPFTFENEDLNLYETRKTNGNGQISPYVNEFNPAQYFNYNKMILCLVWIAICLFLVMFLTVACTVCALESFPTPLHGDAPQWIPKWFRFLFKKYFVNIHKSTDSRPF